MNGETQKALQELFKALTELTKTATRIIIKQQEK